MDEKVNALPPIIIVKRKSHSEHEAHGGVWKIAYADFMTAMMAFFLVMWLVNSADEKTIVQVASYFNPVRLSEKSPSQKGLHDGTSSSREVSPAGSGDAKSKAAPTLPPSTNASPLADRRAQVREAGLFVQPSATIEALDIHPSANGAVMHKVLPLRVSKADDGKSLDVAGTAAPVQSSAENRGQLVHGGLSQSTAEGITPSEVRPQPSDATFQEISRSIARVIALVADPKPSVDVQSVGDDVLITVSDGEAHEMFARGSAEPRPALVALISRIGDVLAPRTEAIVVRGHTDSAPFRSAVYDNWRLSTARAHMAHYMLLRVGVDARRIERVEGHADRQPRNRAAPRGAENRRIEFLLRSGPA